MIPQRPRQQQRRRRVLVGYNSAMQVTARELKLRLGHYLEAVRHGQTLCVTWRGQAVYTFRRLSCAAAARYHVSF